MNNSINKITFIFIILFSMPTFIFSQIPEATTGFRYPLNGTFSNNGGYQFLEWTGTVYHPAEDLNQPTVSGGCGTGCNSDMCLDVVAAANGKVVYVNTSTWGGIVIQHLYQGQTWYSQYGHIRSANVSVNQNVTKGQKIAEIGRVGTDCAHLHFEIREADHPDADQGDYWNGLGNSANVQNWYEDPDSFIPSHPAYNGNITCNIKVNNIDLTSGWKFWKAPPIPSNFYNLLLTLTGLPSGSNWSLYIANSSGIIAQIAANQSVSAYNFIFSVPTSSSSFPNGGGYKFILTPQGQPSTIWCESSQFYISSLPSLSVSLSPSSNLKVGESATLTWIVSGGIPGLANGGWTGNIRFQFYQNGSPKGNLGETSVSNGSYAFTVPSSIQGANIPGCNFTIAGVNADQGTSIPGGYVSSFTNQFCISTPSNINEINEVIPEKFNLYQNYPNPFNPVTKIKFGIPIKSYISLKIFNLQGQEVLNLYEDELQAGTYEYIFNGAILSSGIYFYKFQTEKYSNIKKMILIK